MEGKVEVAGNYLRLHLRDITDPAFKLCLKRHNRNSISITTYTDSHHRSTKYPPHNIQNQLATHAIREIISPPYIPYHIKVLTILVSLLVIPSHYIPFKGLPQINSTNPVNTHDNLSFTLISLQLVI